LHGALQRCRGELAAHGTAALGTLDQLGAGQHVEVLHHARQGKVEWAGDLGDGEPVLVGEALQDCPPRRVGKGGECEVEVGFSIVNHTA